MKYVQDTKRKEWHVKALHAAMDTDLHSLIELLLETKEIEQLAEVLRGKKLEELEEVSHFVLEPAAKALEKKWPEVAARLWCAQGLRVLNAKKSKYYSAAVSNFEHGRACFEKAGADAEWKAIVEQVRGEHRRKVGFMSGFEEVVAGGGPSKKPSFLERAKSRWSKK